MAGWNLYGKRRPAQNASHRRLRQPTCQISITWKDSTGKPAESPLRWSFQIDRDAAYLPEGE
jgi:hypothetical protein